MSENIKQKTKKTETKRGRFISRMPKKRLSQTKNKNLPVEQVLHLQRTIGNRALNRLIRSGAIQAKLTVGKPNDIYEKEADSVADKVMSMPDKSPVQRETAGEEEKQGVQTKPLAEQITPLIRRQAEEEEKAQTKSLIQKQEAEEEEARTKPLIQRQAEKEEEPAQTKLLQRQEGEEEKETQTKLQRQPEEEEKNAQTKAAPGNAPQVTPNIESNINEMKGGGQPLSESTRAFFEPRFGADFSQVRIHNNSKAANTAQSINAKAFTTGKNIVFNSGQYSPGTSSGKRLLAHELTHVVQQDRGNISETLNRQQNQINQPQIVLSVKSTVKKNITDAEGNVIGMSGTQTVIYRYADGREVTETWAVDWRENDTIEPGQATQYEHPALEAVFQIYLGEGTIYSIQTTHPEGGIAIHEHGRSEGCIIAGNEIRGDIVNRLADNQILYGEIANVADERKQDQIDAAPIKQ